MSIVLDDVYTSCRVMDMNTTTMTMTTGSETWTAVELCANTWGIVNSNGKRYADARGYAMGFESREWAESAMRRIAKRWGYRIS